MPAVAIVAIVVAVGMFFMIGMMAAIMLPALARAREAARRASCQNNLKQVGLVMKMYANESKGERFPALSSEPGNLMMANVQPDSVTGNIHPEFLTDLSVLICPSDSDDSMTVPTDLRDHSYWYLGYVITNQAELESFHYAYMRITAEGGEFADDIEVGAGRGSGGLDRLLRLREGVERFFIDNISDAAASARLQSEIPIMMDRMSSEYEAHHIPGGGNVLFMDGHVEYIKFPNWPYTPEAVELLHEMDALDNTR
jgi:prepilin-type processing-associated H-X9-DG protein